VVLARFEGKVFFRKFLQGYAVIRYVQDIPGWGRRPFVRDFLSLRMNAGRLEE
jgi:hypothetical protein